MGVIVRHLITIDRDDQDAVDEILTQFYERGDIDSVTVEDQYIGGKRSLRLWIECGEDELMAVQNELTNHGVEFT